MNRPNPLKAVLLNETGVQRHIGCELVSLRIEEECKLIGIQIVAKCPNNHDWEFYRDDIASADLCIVNGEGTIHDDRPHGKRLLESVIFCNERNTPIVLINALYQNNGKYSDTLLRRFDRVYLRDNLSLHAAEKAGCVDARVVPDLTLSYRPTSPSPIERRTEIQLFDGSVLPRVNHKLFKLSLQTKSLFVPISGKIRTTAEIRDQRLSNKWKRKNTKTRLRGSLAKFAYRLFLSTRIMIAPSRYVATHLPASSDIATYTTRLLGSQSLTTGRFHSCCLAIVTRTPFHAVTSNSHKIEALLSDCGLDADIRLLQIGDNQLLNPAPQFSTQELSSIESFLGKAQTATSEMFRDIAELGLRSRTETKNST